MDVSISSRPPALADHNHENTRPRGEKADTQGREPPPAFDLQKFLDSVGASEILKYADAAVIYSQGDLATDVFYVQQGSVRLTVLSTGGKEGVVGVMVKGDFFGEGCLAGQPRRMATASAIKRD